MIKLFQRLLRSAARPAAESVQPRLTLAAFGKHPGWKDHIPGIGVETEALAHVKHAMYVTGIGGRIDAGAWSALEAGKRLEGFDHTFLCLREGHVILGQMFSSEDGLHRREYPMVLCVDATGVSSESLLVKSASELDRLRAACQATASTEQVAAECRSAEERLRAAFATPAHTALSSSLSAEVRQRFLDHPSLGPDRTGMLRVLHELGSAGDAGVGLGGANAAANAKSNHLRLPLAADSPCASILLWAEFLRLRVAPPIPLLLLSRPGLDWLDAIIGEPVSDDFFCLQASVKALPLASQIPYELAPELKSRLQLLETRFLQVQAAPLVVTPVAASQAVVPPPEVAAGAPHPSSRKGGNLRLLLILGAVILTIGVALWAFSGKPGSSAANKPSTVASNSVPAKGAVVVAQPPVPQTNADGRARAEAQLKAEAERARVAAEKKLADAQAAEAARLKALAAEQTNVGPAGVPVTAQTRLEDAKAQARARENDVDLAQIALAQGNYERAAELCRKWPGLDVFKPLLAQITAETNQLGQAEEMLKAGDYNPILTNRLPENSKFKAILTTARAENKILDQASVEFARGQYDFLQQPEVLALKAKPPFQKLIEAGTVEVGYLKQAQGFKADNNPQAARDLIEKHQLRKPSFVAILNWSAVELERTVGLQRDWQAVEADFKQGDYANALALCSKYALVTNFDALAKSISLEQGALADARKKFAEGDYSFIADLAGVEYRTKTPFARLLQDGAEEQITLAGFDKLKQAGDWQALQGKLDALPSTVSCKKPFAALRSWSQTKADEQAELRKRDPVWLDAKLEVLLVQFGIYKPTDSRIKTPEARKEKALEGGLDLNGVKYYQAVVNVLETEYNKGGWLEQGDRKKLLKDLRDKIKYAN